MAVTETTVRALRDIQPDGDDLSQPVFGLTGEALANRVSAAPRAAGLGDGYTGHSGRVGMAQDLVAAGTELTDLQNAGRWQSPSMPVRYSRGQKARGPAAARWPGTTGSTGETLPLCGGG